MIVPLRKRELEAVLGDRVLDSSLRGACDEAIHKTRYLKLTLIFLLSTFYILHFNTSVVKHYLNNKNNTKSPRSGRSLCRKKSTQQNLSLFPFFHVDEWEMVSCHQKSNIRILVIAINRSFLNGMCLKPTTHNTQ